MAVGSPNANEIIKVNPESESLPGNALFLTFGGIGTESPFIVTELLFDFYRRINEQGLDPYMPIIKSNKETYMVDEVGVFDKKKMKAILSPDETRAFKHLLRNYQRSDFSAKSQNKDLTLSVEQYFKKIGLHMNRTWKSFS